MYLNALEPHGIPLKVGHNEVAKNVNLHSLFVDA